MKSDFERARWHLEKAREIIAKQKNAESDVTISECCMALDLLTEALLTIEYARPAKPAATVPFRRNSRKNRSD